MSAERNCRRNVLKSIRKMLRWHVCRVNFARKIFLSHEFSYEKCSEIFPEIFEPLFCGSEKSPENSLQISHKFFQISLRKIKKITDELLQERREKKWFEKHETGSKERSETCPKNVKPLSRLLKSSHRHFSKSSSPPKICIFFVHREALQG